MAGAQYFLDNGAVISIILLPLNALALAGLFYGRSRPFLLHLVATLHAWSGSVLWFIPPYFVGEIVSRMYPIPALKLTLGPSYMIFTTVYMAITFRKIFRASTAEASLKAVLVCVWTMALSMVAMLVILTAFVIGAARGAKSNPGGQTKQVQQGQIRSNRTSRLDELPRSHGLQQPSERGGGRPRRGPETS